MNYKIYQEKANRTLVDLGSVKANGAHMAMGVVTELEELFTALMNEDLVNVVEEHGDTLWYVAGFCKTYNLDINSLFLKAEELKDHVRGNFNVGELVDLSKKEFAYNKEMDINKLEEQLVMLLADLIDISEQLKFTLKSSMEINITKLESRYPDKYSDDKAVNRDLLKERKILEDGQKQGEQGQDS